MATSSAESMHFYPNERVALFIDGANLYATAKSLGFDIDYKRLLALFRQKAQLVRALYYTALAEDQEYSSIRPLIDWLDYNGFTMVTKPTKEFTDASGRRKVKGNMDIELAVDAIRLAENLDHIVIFSGDGDFRSLVASAAADGQARQRRRPLWRRSRHGRRRVTPSGRSVHRHCRPRAAHLPRSYIASDARTEYPRRLGAERRSLRRVLSERKFLRRYSHPRCEEQSHARCLERRAHTTRICPS